MPDVKQVTAIVANPNRRDPRDTGRVTYGYYVIEDGLLIMTDGDGKGFRGRSGERVTHKLQPGEEPDVIAQRLTRQIYRALNEEPGQVAGFNRALVYRNNGIA
jgi:hypothetical protein